MVKQPTFKGDFSFFFEGERFEDRTFTQGWLLEEDVFLCTLEICFHSGEKWISFPVNASTVICSPLRRSLYYSQLTAVKYPCSSRSQIPLRQKPSITHSFCPSPSTNVFFFLSFEIHKSALSGLKLHRRHAFMHLKSSVYRLICMCLTCSSLSSSFSVILSQLHISAMPAIRFASTPSTVPRIHHSLFLRSD